MLTIITRGLKLKQKSADSFFLDAILLNQKRCDAYRTEGGYEGKL